MVTVLIIQSIMIGNTRFLIATHIMVGLAGKKMYMDGQPLNSEYMAYSVNTNPVVIRRIVSELKRAGLVDAKTGPNGGAFIAKDPSRITLADIYNALKDGGDIFNVNECKANHCCVIGRGIKPAFTNLVGEAESALLDVLAKKTIKEFAIETIDKTLRDEYKDQTSTIEELVQKVQQDENSTFEHLEKI